MVQECDELNRWNDAKDEDERVVAEARQLEELQLHERVGEMWQDDWLRIFTDGGVQDPEDARLSIGECGIFFGPGHPLNTSDRVSGKKLDSYRAELQAVRLLITGTRRWSDTKLWITLDNEAVVDDT